MEYAVFQAPKMDVFRIKFSSLREFQFVDKVASELLLLDYAAEPAHRG